MDVFRSIISGLYDLVYKICEIANPTNCDTATVAVNLSDNGTNYKIRTSTNGKGTVTANPVGPNYASGTVVTLTATPDAGQPWIGWAGDCAGTAKTCTLTMTSNKSVTAIFR